MSASLAQGVLAVLFLIIAICTFMLQGKQWMTFIPAVLFGMFFGGTEWGAGIMRWVSSIAMNLFRSMS
ncbi:hypothetical protein [Nonomuraea sp. NPDC003754]